MSELTPEWVRAEAAEILTNYEGDPDRGHGDEDALIEAVIRELAPTSELAAALLPLLDTSRTKWYA